MDIERELIKIARNLMFDADVKIVRGDHDEHKIRKVFGEVHAFLDKVRKNENVEIYVACRGDLDEAEISIGLTDHEAKDAILNGAINKIKKIGKRMGVEVVASRR